MRYLKILFWHVWAAVFAAFGIFFGWTSHSDLQLNPPHIVLSAMIFAAFFNWFLWLWKYRPLWNEMGPVARKRALQNMVGNWFAMVFGTIFILMLL